MKEELFRSHMTVRLPEQVRDALSEEHEKLGNAKASQTLLEVINRGLLSGASKDEIDFVMETRNKELESAMEAAIARFTAESGKALEKALGSLGNASKDIHLAKKNISHSTQAALATFAYMTWFAQAMLSADAKVLGDDDTSGAGYVSNLSMSQMYKWFWRVGGALQRDPSPANAIRAYRQMVDIFSAEELEGITGVSPEQWKNLTAGPDTAGIARLADRDKESRSKGGRP